MKRGSLLIDRDVCIVDTPSAHLTLMGLFVPFFVEQLLMNLMGTVNTLVLGHYSDDAVAAVGAANQVIGFIYTFYAVVSGGASIVISHKLGAGKESEASDAAFSALVFEALLSILGSIVMFGLAMPIMKALNLTGDVLNMAAAYFRICIGFSFMQGIISASSAILRSYGHPKPAVVVSLLMNAINAVLNYVVVYRPFETPLSGALGIAVVNVFARFVAMAVIIIMLIASGVAPDIRTKNLHSLACMKQIMHVGIPGGVGNLSYSFSQVVSTSILAVLGTIALSTKIYVATIVFYVYVVGYSLGLSTAILIGWMTGAKEYDKAFRLNQGVLKISVLLNASLSILLYVFHRFFIGLFTQNPEIIRMSGTILLIDIFVEIGRALNHIEANSLQGAGDVLFVMYISIASCWGMSILMSYVLGIWLGWGLYGCWMAFMMDELFRGIIFFIRFRSRKWVKYGDKI